MTRITIGGCRYYNDYDEFKSFVLECTKEICKKEIVILSGHCSGADMMAEKYALEAGLGVEVYRAEWKRFGKAAGPKRNREMVEKSDMVIAFWDGKSKGTKNLIDVAKKLNKCCIVKMI